MSEWLRPSLDRYDRKARLRPALLSALPLVTSCVLLVPELGAIWGLVGVAVVYSGGATLLIQIGRDLGRALEERLYRLWGGKPSMAMLRYRDNRLSELTKDRYRSFLSSAVPGLELASRLDEEADPELADAGYDSASCWLLEQTRDPEKFGLLLGENINYGFRRNLLALKPIALGIDVAAGVFVIGMAVASWTGEVGSTASALSPEWWTGAVIVAAHSLVFLSYIRVDWVGRAAETYAQRLLGACDALERSMPE